MRKVISYDFDGCLHTTVDGHDPIEWFDHLMWEPFEEVHNQLREDAKNHKIVIVTARPPITNEAIWSFVRLHNLPVEAVYATDNFPKTFTLLSIGAIKHYDDNAAHAESYKKAGIQFVHVDPIKKTLNEQAL